MATRRIETYELIERYLLGRISQDEKIAIEKRMKDDPVFSAEVEKHRVLQQVMIDNSLIRIKDSLRTIRNQKQQKNIRRRKLYRSMLIAGSCAIILSVSLLLLNKKDSAVRPASEAPGASEAFTGISDTVSSGIKSRSESNHYPVRMKQEKSERRNNNKNNSSQNSAIITESTAVNKLPVSVITDTLIAKTAIYPDTASGNQIKPDRPEPSDQTLKTSPCEIQARYIFEPSCNTAPTGSIRIIEGSVTGGVPPYKVFFDDKPVDIFIFSNLKPGFYKLEIKDSAGCIFNPGAIVINTVDCKYAERFSPLFEVWDIPLDQNKPGVIEIFNKNGILVYKLRFDGTGPETWNGNDLKNSALPTGLYPFAIRYDTGKIFQGTITIMR